MTRTGIFSFFFLKSYSEAALGRKNPPPGQTFVEEAEGSRCVLKGFASHVCKTWCVAFAKKQTNSCCKETKKSHQKRLFWSSSPFLTTFWRAETVTQKLNYIGQVGLSFILLLSKGELKGKILLQCESNHLRERKGKQNRTLPSATDWAALQGESVPASPILPSLLNIQTQSFFWEQTVPGFKILSTADFRSLFQVGGMGMQARRVNVRRESVIPDISNWGSSPFLEL